MGAAASLGEPLELEIHDEGRLIELEKKCLDLEEELHKMKGYTETKELDESRDRVLNKKVDSGRTQDELASNPSCSESTHWKKKAEDQGLIDTMHLRMPDIAELVESNVCELPRGGVYVKTSFGAIQFGIPPETIKDSMKLGLKVPAFYVVPDERFHLRMGINLAEIEFPAYFTFFILQSKVNVIATAKQENAIKLAFQETLEGPLPEHLYQDIEYGEKPEQNAYEARPDLLKEIEFFKEPRGGRTIDYDSLVSFHVFNDAGQVLLQMGEGTVTVIRDDKHQEFRVLESGKTEACAVVSFPQAAFAPTPELFEQLSSKLSRAMAEDYFDGGGGAVDDASSVHVNGGRMSRSEERGHTYSSVSLTSTEESSFCAFSAPRFGVTMLGNSHGFDGDGVTTGFILWIQRLGVAVDPPPHADSYLCLNGVSPRLVKNVILTHCHADHDAGTFQKLLTERAMKLITTKTIYSHFIRKYAAISGLDRELLESIIIFEEVILGKPHNILGAEFEFFYSLHALPCIGFKVTCSGKSISYSGDSFNDKDGLEELFRKGVLSEARKTALVNFPWDCDIVLHEAGIPPIHTPARNLKNHPHHLLKKIYAVHISDAAAEKEGLRKAPAGFANTLSVNVVEKPMDTAILVIRLCAAVEIFKDLGIEQTVKLLELAKIKKYWKGEAYEGVLEAAFFVVLGGILQLKRKNKTNRILTVGDYFGEISAWTGASESLNLYAASDVELITFSNSTFNQLLQKCPSIQKRLETIIQTKGTNFTEMLVHNSVLKHLTFQQKTDFRAAVQGQRKFEKARKEQVKVPLLIMAGSIEFSSDKTDYYELLRKSNRFNQNSMKPSMRVPDTSAGMQQETHSIIKVGRGALFVPPQVLRTLRNGIGEASLKGEEIINSEAVSDTVEVTLFNEERFISFVNANPVLHLALMKQKEGLLL